MIGVVLILVAAVLVLVYDLWDRRRYRKRIEALFQ